MPIYEFTCRACGEEFSVLVRSFADAPTVQCEHCGSGDVRRHVSRPAVIHVQNSDTSDSLQPVEPRKAIRQMSDMYDQKGIDPGRGFSDVVRRVEAGDSPDELKAAVQEAKKKEKKTKASPPSSPGV